MHSYNGVYIFLDDERKVNWNIIPKNMRVIKCKTAEEAIAVVHNFCIRALTNLVVDLDHDLGEGKTGYDFCKWLVENEWTGKFHIHSMNPVGRYNMQQLLSHYGWDEF